MEQGHVVDQLYFVCHGVLVICQCLLIFRSMYVTSFFFVMQVSVTAFKYLWLMEMHDKICLESILP